MKMNNNLSENSITRKTALKHIAAGTAAVVAAPFAIPSFASAKSTARNHHITLAMVGGAHIHAPDFANRMARAENVTTKYIWDPSRDTAERRREVTGGQIAESVSQIANDPEVDGVVICSQTNLHAELVPELARAGKHLFIEKPVGMNGSEAAAIADIVNETGVIFQTGYFMRSQAVNLKIKQLIKDGALGDITRLRLSNVHSGAIGGWFDEEWRWMADVEQAGVGAFGDLGSHAFDLLLWFMEGDNPQACTGHIGTVLERYPGCDEYGEGMVRFESGAVAVVAGGWVDHANPNQVEISGTKGHLRVTNGRLYLRIPQMEADASQAWDDLPESLKHPIELFFDAVAGADVPLISADEAAKVNNLVTQVYRGYETSSWVEVG